MNCCTNISFLKQVLMHPLQDIFSRIQLQLLNLVFKQYLNLLILALNTQMFTMIEKRPELRFKQILNLQCVGYLRIQMPLHSYLQKQTQMKSKFSKKTYCQMAQPQKFQSILLQPANKYLYLKITLLEYGFNRQARMKQMNYQFKVQQILIFSKQQITSCLFWQYHVLQRDSLSYSIWE
ncbi:Hypothetical_protein [Hexamita inflata]|uniref:Hypothetical_protein n=1 Tax=Hexamita inflata TaxID=28002 RepID=A0AA86N464_9EUKA|nr:Hypothetical protein HINF_LOCUS86 [Hexamita inflata]